MKDIFYITIIIMTIACAGIEPKREYSTDLWDIDWSSGCIERVDDNDQIIIMCVADDNFPDDVVAIELWQWIRERQFADKAISQCKEWR